MNPRLTKESLERLMLIDAARFLWWTTFGERIAERKLRRELQQIADQEMMKKLFSPVIEIHIHPITQSIIDDIKLHTLTDDRTN